MTDNAERVAERILAATIDEHVDVARVALREAGFDWTDEAIYAWRWTETCTELDAEWEQIKQHNDGEATP